MFEQSLPVKRRVLGIGHPLTRSAMDGLATAYEHLGRSADALPLRRELLDWQTWRAPFSYTTNWFRSVAMDVSWSGAEADIHGTRIAGAGGR